MTALATLTGRLTLPYRRGAEFKPLELGADSGGVTAIPTYDFAEYRAGWGEDPRAPGYVIAPRVDTGIDDATLTVAYSWNGAKTATLMIPRGTPAGTGFPIPLPSAADATLRLTSLTAVPPLRGVGGGAWDVVALLGNIAKLAWLLGAEKDTVARVRANVRSQRFVESAVVAGLDAIGSDLRVPRFPPRPYAHDSRVIALWHLDDIVPNGGSVVDETTRPGVAGHPGVVAGAIAGAPGKYGTGFAFLGTGSAITVASSPDFDIAADGEVTIEAFVNASVPDNATPRAIIARRASETPAASNLPGWSLCVVNSRGFNANVLFAICDGAREARCFADLSIADGKFHHVAGIIDRTNKRTRLLVDGVVRASTAIDGVGAIAPPIGVRLGSTAGGNALAGVIDEVRISRVAHATFHPVLGEDDEAYRARLRIFRSWVLPTPERVIALINEAAPLGNDAAPYVLVEANRPTYVAERAVRIVPALLAAGLAIALDGSAPRDETVAGRPEEDEGFDPDLDLLRYADPAVDASGDPGGARMQAGAARLLDALVSRLATAGTPGKLVLERSYGIDGPTPLHAVGRALRLRHSTLAVDELGAFAHRAGFAYVRNLGPDLAVAVAAGERLAIRSAPPAAPQVDVGTALDLTVDPALPTAGTFSWTIVTPGPARARLVAHSADAPSLRTAIASRPRVRLVTEAPGDLAVRVEHTYRGRTRSGTMTLRINLATLADGRATDMVGNLDPNLAAIAGTPDPDFSQAYLVTHPASPAIDFGADPNNARMQVTTRDALDALVALLTARNTPGRLRVTQAFNPAGTGVERVGRRLVLAHETLDPGVLGALAARFFDHVARAGAAITAHMRPGPRIAIGQAATLAPLPEEILLGAAIDISVVPTTLPVGIYNWTTRAGSGGGGIFGTRMRPSARFTATQPGLVVLALTYVVRDDTRAAPYTFEIRLKPGLDVPATNIPKPQYDIIMNMLDAFHPIGVEVRTGQLRTHVREIEQDATKAFPAYSFPDFRL